MIHGYIETLNKNMYQGMEKGIKAMLITKTRVQIQKHCLDLILKHVATNNIDLKVILESLLRMHRREYSQMEKIVLYQSKVRIDEETLMSTGEMESLRRTIGELK